MNRTKLKQADRLLFRLQNYCDKHGTDIDHNSEYVELNHLVSEYGFGNNTIDIDKVKADITALTFKATKYKNIGDKEMKFNHKAIKDNTGLDTNDNSILYVLKQELDYLYTHNKNYTKTQYEKIENVFNILHNAKLD